jgi:hypothetical protein
MVIKAIRLIWIQVFSVVAYYICETPESRSFLGKKKCSERGIFEQIGKSDRDCRTGRKEEKEGERIHSHEKSQKDTKKIRAAQSFRRMRKPCAALLRKRRAAA